MRKINFIVLHCTAGPQTQTIDSIKAYWKNVMKWKQYGYHYIIKPNGEAVNLVDISTPSNGVAGRNANSIHISYIGGVDNKRVVDNRTDEQKKTMQQLVEKFSLQFPNAVICGHRDFSPDKNKNGIIEPSEWIKSCPSFEVKDWLNGIGFKSKIPTTYLKTLVGVNIREGAGVNFKAVRAALPKGSIVKKVAQADAWTYVEFEGAVGWIMTMYLDAVK